MKVAVFSAHTFERPFLAKANGGGRHELNFFAAHLRPETAKLAEGFPCVSAFVSDELGADVLRTLARGGTRFLALRSAGYNHVDLAVARELGLRVARVPAYSPHAVAEHAIALILGLNRKTHRAYNRVREGNFSLEGLMGFDLKGRTAGVVGTGKIGAIVARILVAFGCRVLAYDPNVDAGLASLGVRYVGLDEIGRESDILTLHCPLTPATKHLLSAERIARLKPGVMIVNTSRGGLIDTKALIEGLKSGTIGSVGLDVYEEEEGLFFEDLSNEIIRDDVFSRLLTFPNVLITGHQGFFTSDALTNIADTTIANLSDFESGTLSANEVAL